MDERRELYRSDLYWSAWSRVKQSSRQWIEIGRRQPSFEYFESVSTLVLVQTESSSIFSPKRKYIHDDTLYNIARNPIGSVLEVPPARRARKAQLSCLLYPAQPSYPNATKTLLIPYTGPTLHEPTLQYVPSNARLHQTPTRISSQPRCFFSMALQPSRAGFHKLGATEIRVVDIQPGHFDDPIHVSIRVVDFQDKPRYEALSYVWNPGYADINLGYNHKIHKVHKIMVTTTSSATYLPIGWNLAAAMRHLRYEHTLRTMWIDAISINQEDTSERNHQVGLMGTIYSSAERVVVWLGTASEDGEFAMEAISTGILAKEDAGQFCDGLDDILTSDWFFRIWVVQELALASDDPILYCGLHYVRWSQFVAAVQLSNPHKRDTKLASSREHSTFLNGLLENLWVREEPCFTYQVEWLAAIRTRGRTTPFSQQFSYTSSFQATDPRDKVYGLLGICCFRGTPIVPDYAKSSQEVFAEATTVIMTENFTGYAHSQMWARSDGGFSSRWSTATWTLDPERDYMSCSLINFIPHPARKSLKHTLIRARDAAPLMDFSSDYKILHTVGHHIGEVKQRAHVDFGSSKIRGVLTSFKQALYMDSSQDYTELMISALLHQKGPSFFYGKNRVLSVLRTCLGPLNKTTSDPRHMSKEHTSQESDSSSSGDTNTELEIEDAGVESWEVLREDDSGCATDFCMFTTNTGMLGITNKFLALKDLGSIVLAGLFGINMPFILEHLHDDEYRILDVFYAPEHIWGHDFIENAAPGTDCNEFVADGRLKRYNIH
jgi:hypothetical protein